MQIIIILIDNNNQYVIKYFNYGGFMYNLLRISILILLISSFGNAHSKKSLDTLYSWR